MGNKKLLMIVDYQNDFVDGALGFEKAKSLDKGIAERIRAARVNGDYILVTIDTHREDYMETQEGRRLPVPHTIEGTEGWKFYGEAGEELQLLTREVYDKVIFIKKVTFGAIELTERISEGNLNGLSEIEICGVVTNMCVISNAVLCKAILPEARIVINAGLCASFNDELHEQALNVMESMQMDVINR